MARTVMAAKMIADQVKDLAAADRVALHEVLTNEDVNNLTVRAGDGTELGKVVRVAGSTAAKVTDERAFFAWVKANRPDQLRTIIDPEFRRAILKCATAEGLAADAETGEVIPGIEITETAGHISVKDNDAAKNMAKAVILGGGLLALGQAKPARVVEETADIAEWPGLDSAGGDDW